MGNEAEGQQLALFRPAALNLAKTPDRCTFAARVQLDDCYLYLTDCRTWSPDLQEAATFSSDGIAALFAADALRHDLCALELVRYIPIARGLVEL